MTVREIRREGQKRLTAQAKAIALAAIQAATIKQVAVTT